MKKNLLLVLLLICSSIANAQMFWNKDEISMVYTQWSGGVSTVQYYGTKITPTIVPNKDGGADFLISTKYGDKYFAMTISKTHGFNIMTDNETFSLQDINSSWNDQYQYSNKQINLDEIYILSNRIHIPYATGNGMGNQIYYKVITIELTNKSNAAESVIINKKMTSEPIYSVSGLKLDPTSNEKTQIKGGKTFLKK